MPVPVIVPLPDLAATEALAERLAATARPRDCILLEGPLGAGKTALARAFLRAAADDPTMEVPSPSFTLVQIYDTKVGPVFHYDLWRLDGPDSLAELDWDDALDGIVLVEWPDRLGPLRPADALTIVLRLGEGDAREATLTGWEDRLSFAAGESPAAAKQRPPTRHDEAGHPAAAAAAEAGHMHAAGTRPAPGDEAGPASATPAPESDGAAGSGSRPEEGSAARPAPGSGQAAGRGRGTRRKTGRSA